MKSLLLNSAKMGITTLGMAYGLQKLYQVTNFYPADPIFWCFMGFNANLALGLVDRLTTTIPAGFGEIETVASLDAKIQQYQANIAGLNKILKVGSPQGKQAAAAKLKTANANLNKFLKKREELV